MIKKNVITKIEITNIKGIGNKTPNSIFEFDIYANKPNIIVAPNGFGKSSFALAFKSLKSDSIQLGKKHFFKDKENNKPEIKLTFNRNDGSQIALYANEGLNEISDCFDYFVVNGQLQAKATKNFAGKAIGSFTTPPIILINTIPEKIKVDYSIQRHRKKFGANGKVLQNIASIYVDGKITPLLEHLSVLKKIEGKKVQQEIQGFKDRVNAQKGNVKSLRHWIDVNEISFLSNITHLSKIASLLSELDFDFEYQGDYYLAAIQLFEDYNQDKKRFKQALKRVAYEYEKVTYIELFKSFNSSWKKFEPKEEKKQLIIEVPEPVNISNGQRDIMSFIALLKKAELKLKKQNSILIIDEVFDYLDDANLIATHYYVTKLIKEYKEQGKYIYPIILTHLNPRFFNNFVFKNQKINLLGKLGSEINPQFKKLLEKRGNLQIKDNVSKYHLHYHPDSIDIRGEFKILKLKETWGDSLEFDGYINGELKKYLDNETGYDPFAVCCAVRKKVEKYAHNKISNDIFKQEFIDTHKTSEKLKFAESKGVCVPETYYLLGIIYNDGMHYKNNDAAISGKLDNPTIRKMIEEIK